jgi:glycosyltransferase involved in cell wall biosynthesis
MPKISVIICTHNPRSDYLQRTLEALKAQTLSKEHWELLLIDNASKEPLKKSWDLSWHPSARQIREDMIGLTHARLCGIHNATGEWLLFVDDDNVLGHDYLEESLAIGAEFAQIGAFGAANIRAEFECEPPKSVIPYLYGLVICESDKDCWSNMIDWSPARPHGAGLCVRKPVALEYSAKALNNPIRKSLGRSGLGLGAGEDADLAWCAIDIGLGIGRFAKLQITHLVPKGRLSEDYIVRLLSGFAASAQILRRLRKELGPRHSRRFAAIRFCKTWLFSNSIQKRILWQSRKAEKMAEQLLTLNP